MKKIAVFLSAICLFACNDKLQKPDNLLSEDKMEDILYDVALLQSISSFAPAVLSANDIKIDTYIYDKYQTDSLTFAQSNEYYAADFDRYEAILEKVSERLKTEKVEIDSIVSKENKNVVKDFKAKAVKDSVDVIRDDVKVLNDSISIE
ncbi:hypothetical protein Q763_11930 [Flavobacterium beibuense F44-8]|uniref:DUF4296 domain-containing protein n=1 Tax=Flavobacterium beibuense F44-8 TaxID=1406840 RepID=A0A0A2LI58_9FLAO|nr:DUF4296 domain-containing protein [Flavobacterium beibuense]KGO79907.1 hypothetical protein Q763_11930 [Flavobacterium beibuense F44-8]